MDPSIFAICLLPQPPLQKMVERSNGTNEAFKLNNILEPQPNDVLCGRGALINNFIGNFRWRELIREKKHEYVTLHKLQRHLLSANIVATVRSLDPPGRFLRRNIATGVWNDIGNQRANEKTAQALREGAPELRKRLKDLFSTPCDQHPKTNEVVELGEVPPPGLKYTGMALVSPSGALQLDHINNVRPLRLRQHELPGEGKVDGQSYVGQQMSRPQKSRLCDSTPKDTCVDALDCQYSKPSRGVESTPFGTSHAFEYESVQPIPLTRDFDSPSAFQCVEQHDLLLDAAKLILEGKLTEEKHIDLNSKSCLLRENGLSE